MSNTRMTARVPTTPETHRRLRQARDDAGAGTFDDLLCQMIEQFESETES